MYNLNISVFSRYSGFYRLVNGRYDFIYSIPKSILESETDKILIMKQNISLFSISIKEFGDPRFWWVILMINGKQSPDDIQIGDSIRIPRDLTTFFDRIQRYIDLQN